MQIEIYIGLKINALQCNLLTLIKFIPSGEPQTISCLTPQHLRARKTHYTSGATLSQT